MYFDYKLTLRDNMPWHISRPQVMGILNCTPDSFYAGSRKQTDYDIASRAEEIIADGGTVIDVGGMSTRPGGDFVTEEAAATAPRTKHSEEGAARGDSLSRHIQANCGPHGCRGVWGRYHQ